MKRLLLGLFCCAILSVSGAEVRENDAGKGHCSCFGSVELDPAFPKEFARMRVGKAFLRSYLIACEEASASETCDAIIRSLFTSAKHRHEVYFIGDDAYVVGDGEHSLAEQADALLGSIFVRRSLEDVLAMYSLEVCSQERGETILFSPIQFAAIIGNVDMVSHFTALGIKGAKDIYGNTPLEAAVIMKAWAEQKFHETEKEYFRKMAQNWQLIIDNLQEEAEVEEIIRDSEEAAGAPSAE